RRKLIPHGPSSVTVSLPSKWVKNNNLKKGDEIDILEEDNNLLIKPVYISDTSKKIDVSFSGISPDIMKNVLLALHRKSYDEIKIEFNKPGVAKDIQTFLNEMQLGFEIIKQEKDHVLIKSISNPEAEQFDNLFRRIFRITIEYSKKIDAVIADDEDRTYSCLLHETSINRISNYCKRIIVKEKKSNACFLYSIIDNLNFIVKGLTFILDEVNSRAVFSKEFLNKYRDMEDLFSQIYELNYKFSVNEYGVLIGKLSNLKEQIVKVKSKKANEKESWNNLISIVNELNSLLDSIVSMQF
ncbi:MAG: AbrB/MazE/SpoVT family DNA-binding domain-containing protein, partial [Candidatus Woesearchaeota archaeon]